MSSLTARFDHARPLVDQATHDALVDVLTLLNCPEAAHAFTDIALDAIRSGKRFRALLALLGAELAPDLSTQISEQPPPEVLLLAAGLELYQASALAHDDVIDHADTRRGRPTPHKTFATHHREKGWRRDALDFGQAGAILVGDLLFSAAEHAVARQCAQLPPSSGMPLMQRYSLMHAEVALGQYLDVRAEQVPLVHDEITCVDVDSALSVVRRKAARYSVVHPAVLGATAAGVPEQIIHILEDVLTPWGIAFQLRDDDLGVFGDPARTGKPAGDDLIEGKRTVLLALTWAAATPRERIMLAHSVGNPHLSDSEVDAIRDVVATRGRRAHEEMIDRLVDEGEQALTASGFGHQARESLTELAQMLTSRSA